MDFETRVVSDNNTVEMALSAGDKYDSGIELSNACRECYQHRQKATEEVKAKLTTCCHIEKTTRTNSIDKAMDTLRREMVRT